MLAPAVYAIAAYATNTAELYPDIWCEIPDSHHGIAPPAVKKSLAVFTFARAQNPIPSIPAKYPHNTTQSSAFIHPPPQPSPDLSDNGRPGSESDILPSVCLS